MDPRTPPYPNRAVYARANRKPKNPMAVQARALRTRRVILEAAAAVFDERGYEAATIAEILTRGEFTKGAMYFHFPSKEALAHGVVESQFADLAVREHGTRLQETVSLTLEVARRIRQDVLLRAGIRLTIEQGRSLGVESGPYMKWIELVRDLLGAAERNGELRAHVRPQEVAELVVGAFTGIQLLSQALTERQDLTARIEVFWRFLLPSVAVPSLMPQLTIG
jgi:AcrR family transcriptional regulator